MAAAATTTGPPQQTVPSVFRNLVANRKAVFWNGWNWKSAILSSVIRAHLFFAANLTAGWRPALSAGLAELLFRFVSSGFYGSLTQAFRCVQPAWAGAATTALLLPLVSHSVEFLVHWARRTPNLRASICTSVCATAVSTVFNWFAMRRGLLIVGEGQKSLSADLAGMLRLFVELCRSAAARLGRKPLKTSSQT